MALIQCPECNQSISDKASKCPKCGFPIQEYLAKQNVVNDASVDVEKLPEENNSEVSIIDEAEVDIIKEPKQQLSKKKKVIIGVVACLLVGIIVGGIIGYSIIHSSLDIGEINISKWRLTDSTEYSDYYEATITTEETSPFIAVVGYYDDNDYFPEFVYMENGTGILETTEDTDEDPSIKYKPIGYIGGSVITESDVAFSYTDSDYSDWDFLDSSSCSVDIKMELNHSKTGLLVFDLINETNEDTLLNCTAAVIDGKAEYDYYADLPYKARGIDISVVPKFFCESTALDLEDYTITKEYSAEKNEGKYYTSYSGEQTVSFGDLADGFIIYTRELVEGGEKENRNDVETRRIMVSNGECTFTTYDSVDNDDGEILLMPKYEFNIIGYLTWETLEKE